ncbi:MAG: hypothetical protein R6U37_08090 [Dehalococcoidia bacterium]
MLDVDRLHSIDDISSLIDYLRDELDWPVEDYDIDDLTFEWDLETLNVSKQHLGRVSEGIVIQLRNMVGTQPWGIFIVEFADEIIRRGLLREVLRGLVASRRRDSSLPAWRHDNLLFICVTRDYQRITFAHFRGEKITKAKLAMFGWQRQSPYLRTLCKFNLPALQWPDDPSDSATWLESWTGAFDKEPMTKEFFKRFDKALEAIKADLEELQGFTSAEAYSRAQLLLERLLFLYFLQNRGWLNRQRNYLLANFKAYRDQPNECSYYANFLEKLFWTLATAAGDRARFEGIPFLNGGLFDDDEFTPSDKRRKNNPPLSIRNKTFTFVFEHLLEAFNFTVREDTPLNQDVAVDPEMLGKVFESIILHAEAEAEYNAPDQRKATGSYYTPRIVVHFICREALRYYLKSQLPEKEWEEKIEAVFEVDASDGLDAEEIGILKGALKPTDGRRLVEILKPIKTCDPAVGSGAFPVGLLHELVNIRRIGAAVANGFVDPVRREGSNWIHEAKADIVENCLYGVDIQQQAIEICRLRLWLSLIVDYDLGLDPFEADPAQYRQAIQKISQLPNLEMHFRRGDSLLDYICGMNVRVAPEKSNEYRKEYETIRNLGVKLHRAKKSDSKRELRVDILRRRLELSEKVLKDEINILQRGTSQLALSFYTESQSEAANRRKVEEEVGKMQEALTKVATDKKSLEKIASRPYDARFYTELRKLEGADFDSPFNFSWRIDFADIFQDEKGGFDLIVGNPPFVTARNPEKRELYRERWKRVCHGQYLLICPFLDLGFSLLQSSGQLGFIVSNAFTKREFGKPLIEGLFPNIELEKIVDCSGLMFPGHGTPTCIIFGSSSRRIQDEQVTVVALLPGGGDLRTPPEESELWRTISEHHENPGYEDTSISVCSWNRSRLLKWPMVFDLGADNLRIELESKKVNVLRDFLQGSIGRVCFTGADDIFFVDGDALRRNGLVEEAVGRFAIGDSFRNWAHLETHCLSPYDKQGRLQEKSSSSITQYLQPWKDFLENRLSYGQTQVERNLAWWEYSLVFPERIRGNKALCICEIATHVHVEVVNKPFVANRSNPIFELTISCVESDYHFIAGLLNSSTALFWLKQVCYNKGAGENEDRDRFEYAGGKVENLPVPQLVAETLRGKKNNTATQLQAWSQSCWGCGQQLPALSMRKLFEKPGEAYHNWNSALSGYIAPDTRLSKPFQTSDDLRNTLAKAVTIREELRSDMIALQEEMDWLVYAAYGLIPSDSPAIGNNPKPEPITREQRPFVIWAQAGGDYQKAVELIPSDWSIERKSLWKARFEAIRDNEHIRRIEQPVYKRRWDEQWKVGNSWQCGQVAYDAEFMDAFYWWLSEKAEWWLENKKKGGSVTLEEWKSALWQDDRVQASWEVAAEKIGRSNTATEFGRYFAKLVNDQSVPDNIPPAVPWNKIKVSIPANAKRIRGKLNVPRERFRTDDDGNYIWAGVK